MAEIATAKIKIVPDASEFASELENALQSAVPSHQDGARLFFNLLSLLLLVCSPAVIWAVYGWAF
jgi:hypothetical protein